MTTLTFLKRFCPAPVQRYCDTLPVCRYLDRLTGCCTYPEDLHPEPVDGGVLSGRNWT